MVGWCGICDWDVQNFSSNTEFAFTVTNFKDFYEATASVALMVDMLLISLTSSPYY